MQVFENSFALCYYAVIIIIITIIIIIIIITIIIITIIIIIGIVFGSWNCCENTQLPYGTRNHNLYGTNSPSNAGRARYPLHHLAIPKKRTP